MDEEFRKELVANAIDGLKEEQESCDTEDAHCSADRILCDLLTALGYSDVVAEYEKVPKWFA